MARVSIGQFVKEVQAERRKITWPTRKETVTTAIMVVIMTSVLGLFFFGVDSAFGALVRMLLGLVS